MQEGLVFLIASAKLLQELVGELQDLQHLGITLRKGREGTNTRDWRGLEQAAAPPALPSRRTQPCPTQGVPMSPTPCPDALGPAFCPPTFS